MTISSHISPLNMTVNLCFRGLQPSGGQGEACACVRINECCASLQEVQCLYIKEKVLHVFGDVLTVVFVC